MKTTCSNPAVRAISRYIKRNVNVAASGVFFTEAIGEQTDDVATLSCGLFAATARDERRRLVATLSCGLLATIASDEKILRASEATVLESPAR